MNNYHNKLYPLFLVLLINIVSCGEPDEGTIEYPSTYTFEYSEVADKTVFSFDSNEQYEIATSKGTYQQFEDDLLDNFGADFIVSSGFALNKITILDDAQLQLVATNDTDTITFIVAYTLEDNELMVDGLTWLSFDGTNFYHCLELLRLAENMNNNVNYFTSVDNCSSSSIIEIIDREVEQKTFVENDSVGVYLIDLVYTKE